MPELRFPEFQDKGEWECKRFDKVYIFKVTNSLSRDKLNYQQGVVKNIHYGDIHTKFSTLFDIQKEIVPYINSNESLKKIRPESYCVEGDIIFADASEDVDDVGKSIEIVSLHDEKLLSGLHTLLARQKKKKLITGFGGYLFKSNAIRQQIKRESQGAKVLGISAGRLSSINVTYPINKKEQQKIADCLSSLDQLIAAHTKKHEALQRYKKGLLQNLFPAEGESVPKLRFPEFRGKGEWDTVKLGDKTNKIGSGKTPKGGNKNYKVTGRPFVRSQNIGWGCLILDDVAYIDEETHSSFLATEIKKDDVLLNITGASIGRSAVANQLIAGGNVNQHVCIIRAKEKKLNPFFLNLFLMSQRGQNQIDGFQAGGNRQGLNFGQIHSFSIPIPPKLGEQQKIADCLSSIDKLITTQSQKIKALKAHKKGLMQRLFPSMDEVKI